MPRVTEPPADHHPRSQYEMREPCRHCDTTDGELEVRGGQNCVFCARCGRYVYCAPKLEVFERGLGMPVWKEEQIGLL